MDRFSSSASTVPSIDDYFEHNMWNPLLELLFLEQVNGIFDSFLAEIDLAFHVRLGLSMETLLDPGRRFVQESLCARVGLRQR